MGSIMDFLVQIYAVLSLIPFVPFVALWTLLYYVWKNKKLATGISMDVTTFLLIGSVSALYNKVFASQFGFYLILLFFLIAAGLVGNLQNRKKGRVDPRKLFTAIWRFGFVVLTTCYIILFIAGIGKHIFSS